VRVDAAAPKAHKAKKAHKTHKARKTRKFSAAVVVPPHGYLKLGELRHL
jgi:hypothetical protein